MGIHEQEFYRQRAPHGNYTCWMIRLDTDRGDISIRQFRSKNHGTEVECVDHVKPTEFRKMFNFKVRRRLDDLMKKMALVVKNNP